MDDYAAIVAFLLVFASGFCVAYNTVNGFGTHVYFLSAEMQQSYMKTFYVSVLFYNAALMGIKVTFLLQYWRILAVQRYRKVFIVAMVIVFGWSTSQVLVEIFICTPIERFWNQAIDGSCIPNYPQWYINAGGNIITDVIVFALPLPVIGKLNLARGQKYVLLGIFCLGFFTVSISIIRIKFLKLTEDYTWENVEAAGWSIGELCCGFTCSCLLTFRPLVAHWFPGLSALLTRSTNKYARQDYSNESGGILSKRPESHRPRRNVPTSESKDDLYAEAHFELSQHSYRVSQAAGPYGEAGCELGDLEGSPRSARTLSHTQTESEGTLGGLRPDHRAEVTTHIAAGHMTEKKLRTQRSSPIEIRCDIVQEIGPAWGSSDDPRFR
ncbi:hypothetical protein F5X68DRAFT_270834 [Plectosphaerella plurivora]|uniref:Rhodopsin domain-containing protein n=1 Tax=Plectosphaerella plurivora TaxID=936078 RepID=A0A9P8V333_9PEZI|nr:hypothetical protein F5X68DRAFT_270834 [Plectosphaerella plurivora]